MTQASPEPNAAAVSYLQTKDPSAWTTMALVASGETGLSGDHLKAAPGTTALSYTTPIMAIATLGENPRTYPDTDFVSALKGYYDGTQLGDAGTLNDDIFGLIALRSADESTSDATVAGIKAYLVANQNSDGGWGFATGGSSDTNMTSMGIMALVSAGVSTSDSSIQNALTYLQAAQNEDGGFPYDPNGSFGSPSDASSDAWVISALYSAGIDPESWVKDGNTPVSHLKSLQTDAGYFEYQPGSGEDAFTPVTTSYAAIALAGSGYPIQVGASPTPTDTDLIRFHIEGSSGTICSGEVSATTALEVVPNAAAKCGYTYVIEDTSFGPYLSTIGTDAAEGLAGWMYMTNGSQPGVGAADYSVDADDFVLWYFGEFGQEPPVLVQDTVSLSANVSSSDGGDGGGGGGSDTVSFLVTPESLGFGDLNVGQSVSEELTVTNTGSVAITLEALVSGSSLFVDHLKLDDDHWADFASTVPTGSSDEVEAGLVVPSGASYSGSQSADLIFWAIAQ